MKPQAAQTTREAQPSQSSDVWAAFLAHAMRGGAFGYWWELWPDGNKKTTWWTVGQPATIPQNGSNVYFGVHPTVTRKGQSERSKTADVIAVNHLFAEFDADDFDGGKSAILPHLDSLPVLPSVIIDSGGGYHCYWLLLDTFKITSAQAREYIRRVQADWVSLVGGDNGAKDLARVLRVPGTSNRKPAYAPHFPIVTVVQADLDRLYSLPDLEALLPRQEAQPTRPRETSQTHDQDDVTRARGWLDRLASNRCEDYQSWVEVGMSLRGLGAAGLSLWDQWSAQSAKYEPGACEAKWATFEPDNGLTLGSLAHWAQEDTPHAIPANGKNAAAAAQRGKPAADGDQAQGDQDEAKTRYPKTAEYIQALTALGYTFKMNECNDNIEVNGAEISDPVRADIRAKLRDAGYSYVNVAEDAYTAHAYRSRYHPIREYLDALAWDGRDHIRDLAAHFTDKYQVFDTWLARWLVGAVARAYKETHHAMLVLDGPQGVGKSYFARWLMPSELYPSYFHEGPIVPDNKDCQILLISTWVWEVAELGSTTRRADVEALKGFVTRQIVEVRKPYGHYSTIKPALASFIGTINNDIGFLDDSTGSRRFNVCHIEAIDWSYTTMNVSQVWAQAVALYHAGEPWQLTPSEQVKAAGINENYELDDPLEGLLQRYFRVDPDNQGLWMATGDILAELGNYGVRPHARALARASRRLGLTHGRGLNSVGQRAKGYGGIAPLGGLPDGRPVAL